MPANDMHCYSCDDDFTFTDYDAHMMHCAHCEENYCTAEFGDVDCPDCGNDYGTSTSSCNCYDCQERRRDNGEMPYNGIYNYNYVPELRFHGDGDYHLGIELEISAHDDALPIYNWATAHDIGGLFYVKEDSSVDGFEIVTHPMTPDYFESVDWDGFFDMLNATYPLGTTNRGNQRRQEREGHGLHVHVSRTAFPSMTALARWSYLLNRSGRDHMTRIARRVSSQWAAFSDTPVRDVMTSHHEGPTYWEWRNTYIRHDYDYRQVACNCGCGTTYEDRYFIQPPPPANRYRTRTPSSPARYNAVNLLNPNTVEVRLFRSTRSADEFRDTVRTLYSSVEYVRTMQPHHMTTRATSAALSWEGFAEYVRDQYAALYPTVAGPEIDTPLPSMPDTAVTEGAFDPWAVPEARPSMCRSGVTGCVVVHRHSTPEGGRTHRNSMGYSILSDSEVRAAMRTTWDESFPITPVHSF